jgi:hypothetical protein
VAYMLYDRSDHPATYSRQASCIGARAKSLVAVPGFSGRVLAVLPDAVYLSGRDGEILWLCREGVPLHGRGILLPFPLQRLRSGDVFLVEGRRLKIGEELTVDLGRAAEWIPEPFGQGEVGPFVRVNDLVRQLLETIVPIIGDDGPGLVLRGLSSILNGSDELFFPSESWELPIVSPVFDLMEYCLDYGISDIEAQGREMIGLGPGLTPCGDDFLGGLLFAAHWVRETQPGMLHLETRSIFDLLQWARNRTHPISHAILCDLAVGEGPEPLHRLLRLLLRGGELDRRAFDAVDCLLKVGHTTGWYMLAGLLTCLLAAGAEHTDGMARTSLRAKGDSVLPCQAVVL